MEPSIINRSQSCAVAITGILNDEASVQDPKKELINTIMSYLFYEYRHSIDLFSTNELERIIIFSGYSKGKTVSLLETHTKEEIMKMIEEYDINLMKKAKSEVISIKPAVIFTKEVFKIGMKNIWDSSDSNIPVEEKFFKVWEFLNIPSLNVIDMKDLLNAFDHYKIINNAKKVVKDKDNNKYYQFFEKYYANREKKYKDIFKSNLEDNDIQFLSRDNFMESELVKKSKENLSRNITEKLMNSELSKFCQLFMNLSNYLKSTIIEYLDIFSIGKFGQCDKALHNFVFTKFNREKFARSYCLGLFKSTNIYSNDQSKLKDLYSNYFSMLIKRPRIRYGGVYYSRVKYTKVGEQYGFSDHVCTTVTYYRILRFMPNGEVFSLTSPFIKSNKILMAIRKNLVESRSGTYKIDSEDNLTVEMNAGKSGSYLYKYKLVIKHDIDNTKFHGLELKECTYNSGNQRTTLQITDHFPTYFKFRSLEALKNSLSFIMDDDQLYNEAEEQKQSVKKTQPTPRIDDDSSREIFEMEFAAVEEWVKQEIKKLKVAYKGKIESLAVKKEEDYE